MEQTQNFIRISGKLINYVDIVRINFKIIDIINNNNKTKYFVMVELSQLVKKKIKQFKTKTMKMKLNNQRNNSLKTSKKTINQLLKN